MFLKLKAITLLLLISFVANAQRAEYDLVKYTIPEGFTISDSDSGMRELVKIDNKNKTWCKIVIYKSIESRGDVNTDFTTDWKDFASTPLQAYALKENEITEGGGWKFKAGGGKFKFNKQECTVLLTSITGYKTCIAILATTNNSSYSKSIQDFIASFDLKTPDLPATNNNMPTNPEEKNSTQNNSTSGNTTTTSNGYKFNNTKWDDGWTSYIKENWVEVSKPGIQVLLYYQSPEDVKTGWNTLIPQRYAIQGNVMSDYGSPTYGGMAYAITGANAKEKSSGAQVYVALFKGPGSNALIEIKADNFELFKKEFATVIAEKSPWDASQVKTTIYWNKINDMYGRNKFAVGTNDLAGTWFYKDIVQLGNSSNTSAAANNMITIITHEFKFLPGNQYQYKEGNGTGTDTRTENIKLIYSTNSGKYSVTDWQLSINNSAFSSYFQAIKNNRILIITGFNGRNLFLLKK